MSFVSQGGERQSCLPKPAWPPTCLKELGYTRVGLAYAKGNPQSAAFWRKNGFHPTGREVPAEGYTAVVLERELK